MAKKTKTSSMAASALPILKLVPVTPIRKPAAGSITIRQDCIDTLRDLLRQAESGQITGIAYVACKPVGYTYRVVGLARENPTFALGMIEVLKTQVSMWACGL
jgi:hypothetical protein